MIAPVHLLVPGSLAQPTGGYRYDARIVAGLVGGGTRVVVHELAGAFPVADGRARLAVATALRRVPRHAVAVVDGLCLAAAAMLSTARWPARTVALVHHPTAFETGWSVATAHLLARRERVSLHRAHRVVVTSPHTARTLATSYGVTRRRIAIARPGVDRPVATASPVRAAAPQLICVGAVVPRKGHLLLVDALSRLRDRNWRLTCYGALDRDPGLVERLRNRIEAAGLGRRVRLAGVVDDAGLAAAYGTADLLVHAADYEGYGMVLAEALAHGLPVVATSAGAVAETAPAAAALLVRRRDPVAAPAVVGRPPSSVAPWRPA